MAARPRTLLEEARAGFQSLYGSRLRGLYFGGKPTPTDVEFLVILDHVQSNHTEREHTRALANRLALHFGVRIRPIFVPVRAWMQSQ